MNKLLILTVTAVVLLAVAIPVSASDIVISKDRLTYFIGTYDNSQQSFVDYSVTGWDADPMSYTNVVSKLLDKEGVYFGLAPWYTNLAQATLEIPKEGIVYASLVDLKRANTVSAKITKWKIEGKNLRLLCVSDNFPGLRGAPNLDGSFMFPDSSRFIVARSGGGDMTEIWRQYIFVKDTGNCQWDVFYSLESKHLPFEKKFTETWCIMQTPVEPDYNMKVYTREYEADGPSLSDGSYSHSVVSFDSTTVSLWDIAQKKK